jgi:Na+-driven multidrug efflux pump
MKSEEKADSILLKSSSQPNVMTSIKEILKTSWVPMIGMLFHPIYTIVNAASCGRIGDTELAGFGLGSLTLGIMLISIGTCFSMSVGTLVA